MKKLTYVNKLGQTIDFNEFAPLLLLGFSEKGKVNIYTNKGMNQDGSTYLGNTIESNDKTIEIAIIADNETDLIDYRNKINKVFNPRLGEGYLIYKDPVKEVKSKCIIDSLPYFTSVNGTVNKCLISCTASNPFWMDIAELKAEIALWKGDFSFDFEIPDETGVEIGHREPSLIVDVFNEGDVDCGIRAEFRALATVVNPSILNVNTQEFIKINRTMQAGEVIVLNTSFGNKKLESVINGVSTNIFNYIDFQSTFLQLATGDNLFRYDADQFIDNLEVTIYYTPQYLGV
ncbi:phage tail family protein [Clostridium beijerinckii]|uniref:phage tail family protein n=1 Tax=Clostridium beijerinckii TaxID=1520 RepID=UPI00047AB346|nr:phage tail family protein [Clostridium beijerinckii]